MKKVKWRYSRLGNFRKIAYYCTKCGASYIDNYDGYIDPGCFVFCPNCGGIIDDEFEEIKNESP